MDVLSYVKARLGITADVRDAYLITIIEAIKTELKEEKGIKIDEDNPNHFTFIGDYAVWRYQSRDSSGDIPRHLKWRMRNLYVHDEDVQ